MTIERQETARVSEATERGVQTDVERVLSGPVLDRALRAAKAATAHEINDAELVRLVSAIAGRLLDEPEFIRLAGVRARNDNGLRRRAWHAFMDGIDVGTPGWVDEGIDRVLQLLYLTPPTGTSERRN